MIDLTQRLAAGVQFPLFPGPGSVFSPLILKEDTWAVLEHLGAVQDAAGGPSGLRERASAPAPRVFDRAAPLVAGGKSAQAWELEQLEWEHAYVTRVALAGSDSEDGPDSSLRCPCAEEGRILQHNASDRQRLSPYRCQERATCPACGRAYGQGRGAELVSLMRAVLQPGRLLVRESYALAWNIVMSCDERISDHVNRLVVDGELPELRRVLAQLTEDVQAALSGVFGEGVAAVINWHWWHSSNPLAGTIHLHAHVTVPNVSVVAVAAGEPADLLYESAGPLRERALLSEDELHQLRHGFAVQLARHRWVSKLIRRSGGVPLAENAHVRYSTRLTGGRSSLSHRLRYDSRASVVDVLAVTASEQLRAAKRALWADDLPDDPEELALDSLTQVVRLLDNPVGLAWWVNAAHIWQGIQTTRYTGWLNNRIRAQLGLVREKPDPEDGPDWSSVGSYRLLTFDTGGVEVERFREGKRYVQHWHSDHVQLLPPPVKSSRWLWDDTIRPERLAGPPASWLAHFSLGCSE